MKRKTTRRIWLKKWEMEAIHNYIERLKYFIEKHKANKDPEKLIPRYQSEIQQMTNGLGRGYLLEDLRK